MGLLDKFLSKFRSSDGPLARPDPEARPPAGPLRLEFGDFVVHYRERFAVVGLRCLEGDGSRVYHYCLRDENAARAVLVAEEGPEPEYAIQHAVAGDVCWDADELTDLGDEPFRVTHRGEMRVRVWGESGVPDVVQSVWYREYEDPKGERHLVLEDYQGTREVRVGRPVFETEIEFERAADGGPPARTSALGGARAFEDDDSAEVPKGSPRAAALVLTRNVGVKGAGPAAPILGDDPAEDTVEEWGDARDDEPVAVRKRRVPNRAQFDDDDEWLSASQFAAEREEPDAGNARA